MRAAIWIVMGAAIIAGASVNARFWGAALPALAVLFFAVDLLKPLLFAAGGVFRRVAVAAMLISAAASTLFISNLLESSLGATDRADERLAVIDAELTTLRDAGGGGDALAAALARAQADERSARDHEEAARAAVERGEADRRRAEREAAAAEVAMRAPDACGPPEAPATVGPTCRARRANHAEALEALATAETALADVQTEHHDAERAAATASRATATAAAAADQAAAASGRDVDRIAMLEAERRNLVTQLDADAGAPGLATIAAWSGLSPANFSAALAILAGVVAELFVTIAPAGLVRQIGAPTMPTVRLRSPESGSKAAPTPNADAATQTEAGSEASPKRRRAARAPEKAAHGGARFTAADRTALTARARRLVEKGRTKAEAARELGVSASTVKRWLSEPSRLRAVK